MTSWHKPGGLQLLLFLSICLIQTSLAARIFDLEYNPSDFVVAQPSCVHRLPLLQASRVWRGKGIRSFTVINNTALADELNKDPQSKEWLESYGYWEDDSVENGTWRGGNVGDTRAAVTPFLAHKHFGDTYKWMLYGDDDTIFYLTGVLRLLTSLGLDPEVPLALTDNLWYSSLHPSPHAPRCLPCGFNTSAITVTNASFTPRPACPFCARALACGTYGARYRCNSTHLADMDARFGSRLTRGGGGAAGGGGGGGGGGGRREGMPGAMRGATAAYAAWMGEHVRLKEAYPRHFRYKPAMDWEMRDAPPPPPSPADGEGGAAAAAEGAEPGGGGQGGGGGGRRRRRGRRRALLTGGDEGPAWRAAEEGRRRLRKAAAGGGGRDRDATQPYVDGGAWLAAALGRNASLPGALDAAREALRLPYPFCARHDERLHARPASSCLISISGHGGAGMILSVGAMRLLAPEEGVEYVTQQRGCGGGDCLLSRTFWFRAGLGYTDPGSALAAGAGRYDRFAHFIDSNVQMGSLIMLANPAAALLNKRRGRGGGRAPACDRACVWLVEHVAGTHVRAHTREVNATLAAMLSRLRTHTLAYGWLAEARADPEVAAGRTTVVRWVQRRYGNATAAVAAAAAGSGGAAP